MLFSFMGNFFCFKNKVWFFFFYNNVNTERIIHVFTSPTNIYLVFPLCIHCAGCMGDISRSEKWKVTLIGQKIKVLWKIKYFFSFSRVYKKQIQLFFKRLTHSCSINIVICWGIHSFINLSIHSSNIYSFKNIGCALHFPEI